MNTVGWVHALRLMRSGRFVINWTAWGTSISKQNVKGTHMHAVIGIVLECASDIDIYTVVDSYLWGLSLPSQCLYSFWAIQQQSVLSDKMLPKPHDFFFLFVSVCFPCTYFILNKMFHLSVCVRGKSTILCGLSMYVINFVLTTILPCITTLYRVPWVTWYRAIDC